MNIAVLLSGGVDSSVALKLLSMEGRHKITAFYLKIWLEDELAHLGNCPWEEDLEFARGVCEACHIPLEVVSLQHEYHDKVVAHCIEELRSGRTPSPDIFCNERIKFGVFFEHLANRFDKVASGHYAQVMEKNGVYHLMRAPDPVKDQTYFLSNLNQSQLSRILFPIGHLLKEEVRDLALQHDLVNAKRKDSQGICFLGKIPYPEFVKFHLGEKPGDIIEIESGKKIGTHQGYWFHTIGQRKGLRLSQGPWFVVGKDVDKNIVYISHADQHEKYKRNELSVHAINWIAGAPVKKELQVKLRHSPDIIPCHVELTDDLARVRLAKSDPGMAPGQHAIFYDGEICLGGGIIL